MSNQAPSQRATITDVARLAGVSISTVSRVLNNTAPVSIDTVVKVKRAIEILSFQPHPVARSLAGGKNHTIGILLPDLTNPFFSLLMRGIESAVRAGGYDLLVHLVATSISRNGQRSRPLSEHNTDGLIVFTDNLDDAELNCLYARGFPLVLLFRSSPRGLNIPTVNIDNVTGARALFTYLIETCGRRRIVFMQGMEGNEDSYWREFTYRQCLAEHGIPFDPQLVTRCDYNETHAARGLEQLIGKGIEFDAVFTGDDMAAVGVLPTLQRHSLDVPGQVSVVGFDDLPIAQLFSPPLTTVRSPIAQAGQLAAERLIELIRTGNAESVFLPTELVIRKSCR